VLAHDLPGVGGGVVGRLTELQSPVTPCNGCEATIDKERFVNDRAEDYWTLRERFEQGEIEIDPDDDKLAANSARSSEASTHADASRSNRRTRCASEVCRHPTGLMRWP
jgi:hypothetical protein